ncbi:hypothetical protein [Clostridium oceanicum]|uniref:ABC transporter permease n=1 Tax=Clostridium oceanicum TaxID=1543 RepID=A0ABN1JGL6_9CLOT
MKNLIKYELKGCYKEFIILMILQIIINNFILSKASKLGMNTYIVLIIVNLIFVAIVFIFNIKIFVRDLYKDTAYLIFSIPKKSNHILKSKVIVSLIQIIIVELIQFIYIYLIGIIILNNKTIIHYTQIYSIITDIPKFVVIAGPFFVLSYAKVLLIVYFSICLSKVTKRKKKFGKLHSVAIFIIINILIERFNSVINNIFRDSLTLNSVIFRYVNNNMNFYLDKTINIASQAVNLVLLILFWKLVCHMLDNIVEI